MSQRVSEAVELLEKGRQLQAQGDFNAALSYFSKVTYHTSSLSKPMFMSERIDDYKL